MWTTKETMLKKQISFHNIPWEDVSQSMIFNELFLGYFVFADFRRDKIYRPFFFFWDGLKFQISYLRLCSCSDSKCKIFVLETFKFSFTLVNQFSYLSSNILSTERDVKIFQAKHGLLLKSYWYWSYGNLTSLIK